MANWMQKCARLWEKSWVRWLCGYPVVLFCGAALVYYWRVIYALGEDAPGSAVWLTGAVCGIFSLVYLLVLLCAHFLRQDLALKTAVLAALAGLFFVFANPPLQAPDESEHFLRAYSIGSGNFLFNQQEDYPDDVDLLMRYFNGAIAHTQEGGLAAGYRRYAQDVAAGATAWNASTRVQQLIPYLPQAVGVAVGRLLGADAMACMYLARITNLLAYAAMCGAAIWFAGRFTAVLIAVMMCPITLFIVGSCSSDSMFLGLIWIFIGICLSDAVTPKRLVVLVLCFGITFYAKNTTIALLPLLALPPLWENVHIGRAGKKPLSPAARRGLVLGIVLAGGLLAFQLLNGYTALASNYGSFEYFDPNIDPAAQVRFIFSNLPRYAAVFCYTLYRDGFCLFSMGAFGQLDVKIELINMVSPLVLLFAAGCSALEGACAPRKTGWAMGASAVLLYAFTYTGMYLTCTPVTLPEINGVQARYLLPAFFALLVLAAILMGRTMALQELRAGKLQKTPPAWRVLHLSFLWALVSAVLLFQRYYIEA
ncbi:MAG: DUF2142 domain-containing protein [Subdoligranulum sp.]|nr:DUF2142 domain-containing protein [Subdoligranulum sp.]